MTLVEFSVYNMLFRQLRGKLVHAFPTPDTLHRGLRCPERLQHNPACRACRTLTREFTVKCQERLPAERM